MKLGDGPGAPPGRLAALLEMLTTTFQLPDAIKDAFPTSKARRPETRPSVESSVQQPHRGPVAVRRGPVSGLQAFPSDSPDSWGVVILFGYPGWCRSSPIQTL